MASVQHEGCTTRISSHSVDYGLQAFVLKYACCTLAYSDIHDWVKIVLYVSSDANIIHVVLLAYKAHHERKEQRTRRRNIYLSSVDFYEKLKWVNFIFFNPACIL